MHEGTPLSKLATGGRAVVLALDHASSKERAKLMALGVMPGAELSLLQRVPSYVLSVGYTQIAMDQRTAQQIRVREV